VNKTICVLGDVMLDTYVHVTPIRVSSEAPVMICRQGMETYAPGGAANVAANIRIGFGNSVCLVGIQGCDSAHTKLIKSLLEYNLCSGYLLGLPGWQTIEKRRFVDDCGRQMLRIDTEVADFVLSEGEVGRLMEYIDRAYLTSDVLVGSDYGKGTCNAKLLNYAVQQFRSNGKYTIVNGKPDKLLTYRGAHLLVYNLAEAAAAWAQFGDDKWNGTDVASLAGMLYKWLNGVLSKDHRTDILITCGDRGMVLWDNNGPWWQDAIPVRVADVCGAGDTVVATLASYGYPEIGSRAKRELLKAAAENAAEVVSQHGTSICAGKVRI
jgi:rfaE bifunctional protein kinase chain/domain